MIPQRTMNVSNDNFFFFIFIHKIKPINYRSLFVIIWIYARTTSYLFTVYCYFIVVIRFRLSHHFLVAYMGSCYDHCALCVYLLVFFLSMIRFGVYISFDMQSDFNALTHKTPHPYGNVYTLRQVKKKKRVTQIPRKTKMKTKFLSLSIDPACNVVRFAYFIQYIHLFLLFFRIRFSMRLRKEIALIMYLYTLVSLLL